MSASANTVKMSRGSKSQGTCWLLKKSINVESIKEDDRQPFEFFSVQAVSKKSKYSKPNFKTRQNNQFLKRTKLLILECNEMAYYRRLDKQRKKIMKKNDNDYCVKSKVSKNRAPIHENFSVIRKNFNKRVGIDFC